MLTTFFVPEGTNFSAEQIQVDGDEAHHGVNVLRLKEAEEIKIKHAVFHLKIKTTISLCDVKLA